MIEVNWNILGLAINFSQTLGMILGGVACLLVAFRLVPIVRRIHKKPTDEKQWRKAVFPCVLLIVCVSFLSAVSTYRPRVEAQSHNVVSPSITYPSTQAERTPELEHERLKRRLEDEGHSQSNAVEERFNAHEVQR